MIINKEEALNRLAGNQDLLQMLMTKFTSDYKNIKQDLMAFIEKGELEEACRYVHSIKGAAANLAMPVLTEKARTCETQLRENQQTNSDSVNDLEQAMNDVITAAATLFD